MSSGRRSLSIMGSGRSNCSERFRRWRASATRTRACTQPLGSLDGRSPRPRCVSASAAVPEHSFRPLRPLIEWSSISFISTRSDRAKAAAGISAATHHRMARRCRPHLPRDEPRHIDPESTPPPTGSPPTSPSLDCDPTILTGRGARQRATGVRRQPSPLRTRSHRGSGSGQRMNVIGEGRPGRATVFHGPGRCPRKKGRFA